MADLALEVDIEAVSGNIAGGDGQEDEALVGPVGQRVAAAGISAGDVEAVGDLDVGERGAVERFNYACDHAKYLKIG
ncbi:MAG: hypothetical protein QGH25_15180 [Candidatus Latescibacteria bacterium]|nr:hypothetical protein [Candidatus Latescibacterota bacterium]